MYQFTNGATCWKDSENLKLVINDLEEGEFEISGFEDIAEMDNFASCGEFSERNNNFLLLTKSKLTWKYLD